MDAMSFFDTFLRSILKQKTKLFLVVLCFAVMGIFLSSATPVSAVVGAACTYSYGPGYGYFVTRGTCPLGEVCTAQTILGIPISPGNGTCQLPGTDAPGPLSNAATSAVTYTLLVPLWITGLLAYMAKTLLIWVFGVTEVVKFTSLDPSINKTVSLGWPIVRNFANIIIVVALIVIALATILRFKAYEAKQLLAKLIIAALLINFSLVICGIFIDVANITISYLLHLDNASPNGAADGANQFFKSETLDRIIGDIQNNPSQSNLIGKAIGVIFYQIMSAIILFLYFFLFLFRIIALWILVILSPIAFACAVLPATKKVFDMWWSNFTQWCFVGVFAAFFFYIGETLMKAMIATSQIVGTPTIAANGRTLGTASSDLMALFSMLVPGFFLVIGFIFSLQCSAVGANYATSAFNKSKGYVQKGLVDTGKWAANKTGLTKVREVISDRAIRLGERYGLGTVKQGTANKYEQDRLAERMKPYEALAEAEKDPAVLAQRAMNSRSSAERAVYTQKLQERNELHRIRSSRPVTDPLYASETRDLRRAAVDNFRSNGLDTTKLTDSDYRYAGFDNDRVQEVANQRSITEAAARTIVVQEKLESNLPSMKPKQLRNIDPLDLTADIVDQKFTPSMIKHLRIASTDHLARMTGPIRTALEARHSAAVTAGNEREENRLFKIIEAIDALI